MKTVRLMVEVTMPDDESKVTVRIGTEGPTSLVAIMAATEHMMTLFAASSEAGFERALELLCDGARSNNIERLGEHQKQ